VNQRIKMIVQAIWSRPSTHEDSELHIAFHRG
jgi:hypothetical protein